jgi:hypothetical protein
MTCSCNENDDLRSCNKKLMKNKLTFSIQQNRFEIIKQTKSNLYIYLFLFLVDTYT